jgi:hypothetical protein
MRKTFSVRNRKAERGQTIVLVAISLVGLLAMAALGIDVASLYSARGEAQKAADAAALAGAKAFVDSGFTTNPAAKTLAESMVSAYASAIAAQNNVAGTPPSTVNVSFDDTTYPGNPQVTVQIQQANLPIFFARIWGVTFLKVGASATAEAYNPSNYQSSPSTPSNFVGVTPSCVKPLAIPNTDPITNQPYVNRTTGVVNGNPTGEAFNLTSLCQPRSGRRRGPVVTCTNSPTPIGSGPGSIVPGEYVPITQETPPATTTYNCPSCATSTQPIQQSLECCNMTTYQCGLGNSNAEMVIDYTGYTPFTTYSTLSCATQPFGLPDTLDPTSVTTYPANPMHISAGAGPNAGQSVNNSSSIMTFPVWDDTGTISGGKIQIIGFVRAFIVNSPTPNFTGSFSGTVLNVVGCGRNTPGTPVSGGGASPVPVRLIHN